MPRPLRNQFPGAIYHAMNRGNGRHAVFRADQDYARFLNQLQHALAMDRVILYAYCLMPNHFHLFVETPHGNLDGFMRRLQTSYAMYFRHRHQSPGHCFQGRYKAPLVDGDEYALRLTRYIHLNPAKISPARDLSPEEKWMEVEAHRWSSVGGYLRRRAIEEFVDYRWLALMAPERSSRAVYRKYLRQMLDDDDPVLGEALQASSYAIGNEAFRKETADWVRSAAAAARTPTDVMGPETPPIDLGLLAEAVALEFGIRPRDLAMPRKRIGHARGAFADLACRLAGQSQREVAAFLGGISEHAVSKARRNLLQALREDRDLAARLSAISDRHAKG